MGMIQREIDKIRMALLSNEAHRPQLYAAQQALEWALEPGGIRSPYAMITGNAEAQEGCPVPHSQPSS